MSFKSYYYHILSWLHYCLDTNYHGCITTLIPQYTASCLSGRSEEAWGRVITNLAEKIPGVFSAGLSLGDFGGKQGNKQGNFYMFNDYRIWDSFEIQWNPLLCRDSDTRETSLISWYIAKPTTPALVSRLGGHKPTDGVGAKAYATEFFSGDGHGKVRMFETWVSDITDICCDISTGWWHNMA